MKVFYHDSFTNIKREGYEPVGIPTLFVKDFLVTNTEAKLTEFGKKLRCAAIEKNNLRTITYNEFEKMLTDEITKENGPYLKFNGIAIHYKNDDELNPSFKVKGYKAGLDYITAIPLINPNIND